MYDALFEMMEPGRANKYLADGTIEIAPLAFMRGRTLNDAFIVLDEAQNTTPEQMKMFLVTVLRFYHSIPVCRKVFALYHLTFTFRVKL